MTRARWFQLAAAGAVTGASLLAAGGAAATEVECRMAGEVRRIEVVHHPDPGLICEVRYIKSERGLEGTVLWIGKHERSFCHDRADQLIARLADTGWVCDVIPKRRAFEERAGETGPMIIVPRPHR